MPEVASQEQQLHPRVVLAKLDHPLPASIGASVVDEDELAIAVEAMGNGAQPAIELGESILLVTDRDHERVRRHGARKSLAPGPAPPLDEAIGSLARHRLEAALAEHLGELGEPLPRDRLQRIHGLEDLIAALVAQKIECPLYVRLRDQALVAKVWRGVDDASPVGDPVVEM